MKKIHFTHPKFGSTKATTRKFAIHLMNNGWSMTK